MVHKNIRIEWTGKRSGIRWEAVGFLEDGERTLGGGENLFTRTSAKNGGAISSKVDVSQFHQDLDNLPVELEPFILVIKYHGPKGRGVLCSEFSRDRRAWCQYYDRLDDGVDFNICLVVRRRP